MKIPKDIDILGCRVNINLVPTIPTASDEDGSYVYGSSNIYLAKENSEETQRSVLLHEIVEAISHRLELNLKHPTICGLDAALLQILRSNPDLSKFLFDLD